MSTLTLTTTFQDYSEADVIMNQINSEIKSSAKRLTDTLAFAKDGQSTLNGLAALYGTFITELDAELDAVVADGTLLDEEARYKALVQNKNLAVKRFNELSAVAGLLVTAIDGVLSTAPLTIG
jgi:uncharacterized phage infection (PIP) family protein YhgE